MFFIGGREVYSQGKVRSSRHKHVKQHPHQQHNHQRYSTELASQPNLLESPEMSFRGIPSDLATYKSVATKDATEDSKIHIKQNAVQSNMDEPTSKSSGYVYDNTDAYSYKYQMSDNEMLKTRNPRFSTHDGAYDIGKEEILPTQEKNDNLIDVRKNNISSASVTPSLPGVAVAYESCSNMEVSRTSHAVEKLNRSNIENQSTNNRQTVYDTPITDGNSGVHQHAAAMCNDNPSTFSVASTIPPQRQLLRETVFSSEIHSIDYDSSLSDKSDALARHELLVNKRPVIGESEDVGAGAVVSGMVSSNVNNLNSAMKSDGIVSISVPSNNKDGADTTNINFSKNEETVVFDDIGDINLHYLSSNSSSNPTIPTADSNFTPLEHVRRSNCDVNVTYDLIQGTMPPPSVSGLIVRPPEDTLMNNSTQILDMPTMEGSVDNLYLGEEASAIVPPKIKSTSDKISNPIDVSSSKDSIDQTTTNTSNQCKQPMSLINGAKKPVGVVEIAQYEGSPRRYRPRISAEMVSNASASSGDDRPMAPQQSIIDQDHINLLLHSPLKHNQESVKINLESTNGESRNTFDELLRFDDLEVLPKTHQAGDTMERHRGAHTIKNSTDDDVVGSNVNKPTSPSSTVPSKITKSDFDFRYEFSETRKVLDEFFNKAENEFPDHTNTDLSITKCNETELINVVHDTRDHGVNAAQEEGRTSEFNDLNYTLRRFSPNPIVGSTAVGQRLAENDEELVNTALFNNTSKTLPTNLNVNSLNFNDVVSVSDGGTLVNPEAHVTDSRKEDSLATNNIIDKLDVSEYTRNEMHSRMNAGLNQTLPSNTYQTQPPPIRNIQPLTSTQSSDVPLDTRKLVMPSQTELAPVKYSVASGFPLSATAPHSSTLNNSTNSTGLTNTNHITTKKEIITSTTDPNTKHTPQNLMRGNDESRRVTMISKDKSFVILNDPNHTATTVDQTSVSNIDGMVTMSTRQKSPQYHSATALVGNMRLNVARHYVTAANDFELPQPLDSNADLPALTYHDDGSRDNLQTDDIYRLNGNNQTASSKDSSKLPCTNVSNPSYCPENKNMEAITSLNTQNINTASGGNIDSRNFTLSPETTDCDSADLESEVSINEGSYHSSGPKFHTAMPILEDGLSSGHASDLEDDVIYSR